jgi:hypothetical protein
MRARADANDYDLVKLKLEVLKFVFAERYSFFWGRFRDEVLPVFLVSKEFAALGLEAFYKDNMITIWGDKRERRFPPVQFRRFVRRISLEPETEDEEPPWDHVFRSAEHELRQFTNLDYIVFKSFTECTPDEIPDVFDRCLDRMRWADLRLLAREVAFVIDATEIDYFVHYDGMEYTVAFANTFDTQSGTWEGVDRDINSIGEVERGGNSTSVKREVRLCRRQEETLFEA